MPTIAACGPGSWLPLLSFTFWLVLTLQSRSPSPSTRSRWRGRSESRAEGRRSRCVAAASRATAKPGGGQGGPPLRGRPRPASPGHPCTPLGHPSRAPLWASPLGQAIRALCGGTNGRIRPQQTRPARLSRAPITVVTPEPLPALSLHPHAPTPPSLHRQTDRQTDRQRNARPKPRTTIVVVWQTDVPSLHRRAWHPHPDSPARLRPSLHRRTAC